MAIGSRTSAQRDIFPAARWLLPSIGDLIYIALLGLLTFTALSVRLLGDAGIGWHIRTGQLILATHSVPHVDPFSSTMAGYPWFAWEWLYDLLAGYLDSAAGLNGVVFFTALVIALTFSWTYFLLLRRGTNFLVALVLVLLAASAAMIHFFARPHVVSWLFTVVWFAILDSSETKFIGSPNSHSKNKRFLWLLPVLMLVWVNVHGGFLLGFALLGTFWLSAVWQYFRLTENRFDDALEKLSLKKRAYDLALVSLLSALATLANPYGWRLHIHIFRYLSNRFLMDHIDEFQSPNFHAVAQKCFAVLLMLALIAFTLKSRERAPLRISQTLIVLFAVYSALYASRNIPVSALLLILVIGPRLSDGLQSLTSSLAARRPISRLAIPRHFVERMQLIETALRGHVWPGAAVALTCWATFHGGNLGTKPLMNAHFDAKRFPVAAVNYLAVHDVPLFHAKYVVEPGPVFVPDFWGGYLIYRLFPQIKVAVDDRHDFYGDEFLKSYLKMMHVEPGWEEFLAEHTVRYVIVPKNSAVASILAETSSWQPIYNDEVAVIFAPAVR